MGRANNRSSPCLGEPVKESTSRSLNLSASGSSVISSCSRMASTSASSPWSEASPACRRPESGRGGPSWSLSRVDQKLVEEQKSTPSSEALLCLEHVLTSSHLPAIECDSCGCILNRLSCFVTQLILSGSMCKACHWFVPRGCHPHCCCPHPAPHCWRLQLPPPQQLHLRLPPRPAAALQLPAAVAPPPATAAAAALECQPLPKLLPASGGVEGVWERPGGARLQPPAQQL